MPSKPSRIFTPRKSGIPPKSRAPFWRGERAEAIVEMRRIERASSKSRKKRR